jgi:hypothetical protein
MGRAERLIQGTGWTLQQAEGKKRVKKRFERSAGARQSCARESGAKAESGL